MNTYSILLRHRKVSYATRKKNTNSFFYSFFLGFISLRFETIDTHGGNGKLKCNSIRERDCYAINNV